MDQPKPLRRLQFSLAALLVITTICAILFAWWRDRTRLQHQLERELQRAVMARQMALQAEVMARREAELARQAAEMARQRAEDAQAAAEAAAVAP